MRAFERAVLVLNGSLRDHSFHRSLLKDKDWIVGVDGGCNHLYAMGISPHVIVGDLDSIGETAKTHYQSQTHIEWLRFPVHKNQTDAEIALELTQGKGLRECLILGGIGGRMDHTLANLHLLIHARQRDIFASLVDEDNSISLLGPGFHRLIGAKKGQTVSFISALNQAEGIFLEGFAYPLQDYTLQAGSSRCISNIAVCDQPAVRFREGLLYQFLCDPARWAKE